MIGPALNICISSKSYLLSDHYAYVPTSNKQDPLEPLEPLLPHVKDLLSFIDRPVMRAAGSKSVKIQAKITRSTAPVPST